MSNTAYDHTAPRDSGTMLQVTPARAFSDNYIWLIHSPRDASRVVAVDPGDANPVERVLVERNLSLAGILITHHHLDHVGGVAALLQGRKIPIFGPAHEQTPGEPVRLREGDRAVFPELGARFRRTRHTGSHRRPHRLRGPWRGFLRRYVVQRGVRSAVRGYGGADVGLPRQTGRVAARHAGLLRP